MGQIHVDGIGIVDIAGDTPTEEEARAIAAGVSGQGAPAAPPERSIGGRVLHGAGLAARMGLQGVAALPNLAGDAINSAVNLGIRGVNAATGAQIPELGRMSDVVQRGIDAITPQPEDITERVGTRIGTDLVSMMTGMGAARAAGRVVGQAIQPAVDAVTASPWTQAATSTGAGAGAGLLHELLPSHPLAAELGGAAVGALAGGLPVAAGRVLLSPWYRGGQERIITNALLNSTDNPQTLNSRLAINPHEIVPGSPRTTAEVAGDPAMLATERGMRVISPRETGLFANQDAAREAARRTAIEGAGPPMSQEAAGNAARAGLDAERRQAADNVRTLYQSVPDNAGAFQGRQLYAAIYPDLERIYGRSTQGLPPELVPIVQRLTNTAGNLAYGDLRAMSREMGDVAGRAAASGDRTLAGAAGGVRDAIEAAMGAPGGGLTPQQRRAHNAAVAARRQMGASFDEDAVGTALDRNQYGRPTTRPEDVPRTLLGGPTPVRQTQAAMGSNAAVRDSLRGAMIDDLLTTMRNNTPNAGGGFSDSAARFHGWMQRNADAVRGILGAQHQRMLDQVAQDMMSRQMVDSVGRAIGSNTVQNLSTAHVIGALFGGIFTPAQIEHSPLLAPLRGLQRLTGSPQALQELFGEALRDPALAQVLASRATPQMIRRATAMLNQTVGQRIGGAIGDAAQGTLRNIAPAAIGEYGQRP